MIATAIYQRLSTTEAITGLVGDRIYPMQVPPDLTPQLPYLVYLPDDRRSSRTYAGKSKLYPGRVTVFCVAGDFSAVKNLGDAVFNALESQAWLVAAPVTDPPPETPAPPIARVQGAFYDDQSSDGVVMGDDEDPRCVEDQVYLLWVEELA